MVISFSIFAGINGVDDAWKQERLRQARIGGYVFLAGIPLLGTGIPLMQLQKRRLDEIVDYYNGDEFPDEPPHAQLTFGPTANGVGFALKF